jgi:hypothetical protein
MADARPLKLKRSSTLDWPALIRIMGDAVVKKENHVEAARWLAQRLFSDQEVHLGFRNSLSDFIKLKNSKKESEKAGVEESDERDHVIEMRNSIGLWERRGGKLQAKLGDALVLKKGEWVSALTLPDTLSKVQAGNPCRFGKRKNPTYGRELPLAVYDQDSNGAWVTLIKSFRNKLREAVRAEEPKVRKKFSRKKWRRDGLEEILREFFPRVSTGGELDCFIDRGKVLGARLRYESATVLAWRDARGKILLNPPLRQTTRVYDSPFRGMSDSKDADSLQNLTAAEAWFELGLIDEKAKPTIRGTVFSCFSRGEGLAIAAALEDQNYPIKELVLDLVNLRAGHRFVSFSQSESRLAIVCRETFGFRDCSGYLRAGLPLEYGEGAAEIIRDESIIKSQNHPDHELSAGDWERVKVEWRSLLSLIANGIELPFLRWSALQDEALHILGEKRISEELPSLPEMPVRQKERFRN